MAVVVALKEEMVEATTDVLKEEMMEAAAVVAAPKKVTGSVGRKSWYPVFG